MPTGLCSIVLATAMSASAAAFGDCSAVFNYADFSTPSGLTLAGLATTADGVLRLTPAGEGGAGAAWYTTTQAALNRGFVTTFHYDIKNGSADGFAFVMQSDSDTALGGTGSGMGYDGIHRSVAIEFDTFIFSDEMAGPHVSVQTRGADSNSTDDSASIAHALLPDWFADGGSYEVKIEYTPGVLYVFLEGEPILFCPLDLSSLDDGGPLFGGDGCAYVGFTGGAGAATADQEIGSWQFNDWTTTSCGSLEPTEFSGPWDPPRTGDRVVLRCTVGGPGPRVYQWLHDDVEIEQNGRIIGEKSEVMIIDPYIPADAGSYQFHSGNDCGGFGIGSIQSGIYCPGDLNEDGVVDDADFVIFVPSYNALVVPDADKRCDWNGDGFVEDADFVFFVGYYNNLLCE